MRQIAACFLGAMSLSLAACTVYEYRTVPAQPKQQPAQAPVQQPATPGIFGNQGTPPAGTSNTPPPAGNEGARRITAPCVFGNGTGGAFRGLAYVIPEGTQRFPDVSRLVPFAELYTDKFDVNAPRFTGGFPGVSTQDEWFAIRYTGRFVQPADADAHFRLFSADGANLYIDGAKVIDHDGVHGPNAVTSNLVHLKAGSHNVQVDYFKAKRGEVALQVFVSENGAETYLAGAPR